MRNLTRLTKPENCFYAVNNQVLRNLQDLLEFLMNCDHEQFSHHVNDQKNDFANWVEHVLLFPELAQTLRESRTINKISDAIMEFFQNFDYRSVTIPEEKYFFTIDNCRLKNLHELFYYLNNCSDESYKHHVTEERNDFSKWVDEVLSYKNLASKIASAKDHNDMLNIVKNFLLNNSESSNDEEYRRYMIERKLTDKTDIAQGSKTGNNIHETDVVKQEMKNSGSSADIQKENDTPVSSTDKHSAKEETILFDRKVGIRPEEEEKQPPIGAILDKGVFRQFTDEELDHFVQFVRKEKPDTSDPKVDYLRVCLQELRTMIADLWKNEKDPLIPDLMIRGIGPKIEFYALSKNVDDYNMVIREMKDLQREILECDEQTHINLAEELFNDLKLQGIAMKKT